MAYEATTPSADPLAGESISPAVSSNDGILENILALAHSPAGAPPAAPGLVVGRIVSVTAVGEALVEFTHAARTQIAASRTLVPISPAAVGRQAALGFEQGDAARPIILGLLVGNETAESSATPPVRVEATLDGQTVRLTATNKLELRCGQASIQLTADGKVLIRGDYVLSRASGTNRIRGGNVQIN